MKLRRNRRDINRHVDARGLAARKRGLDRGAEILDLGDALRVAPECRCHFVIIRVAQLGSQQAIVPETIS